jgi:moderate conductance mechanosensitive channel
MMSSPLIPWLNFEAANALHLAGIIVLAVIGNWLLRRGSESLVQKATGQSRSAQQREQQTRALADRIYHAGRACIWLLATISALPEFGITVWPAALIFAALSAGLALGSQATIRDVLAGIHITIEDQFAVSEMIQVGETIGRVEQFTLRRTVLRDGRGALVTLANGALRQVSNLSRDWSQGVVDVALPGGLALEKPLQALEAAAAGLRSDAAWSQALVDGPRVLGVQNYDAMGVTLRLQVRTAPTRQEEVCRELRRRIHLEFQRQGIGVSTGRDVETTTSRLT